MSPSKLQRWLLPAIENNSGASSPDGIRMRRLRDQLVDRVTTLEHPRRPGEPIWDIYSYTFRIQARINIRGHWADLMAQGVIDPAGQRPLATIVRSLPPQPRAWMFRKS
jgi:hypothetical protein